MEKCGEDHGGATGNDNGEYMGLLNETREVHAPQIIINTGGTRPQIYYIHTYVAWKFLGDIIRCTVVDISDSAIYL